MRTTLADFIRHAIALYGLKEQSRVLPQPGPGWTVQTARYLFRVDASGKRWEAPRPNLADDDVLDESQIRMLCKMLGVDRADFGLN